MDGNQSLDVLILSQLQQHWLKTARIIVTVLEELGPDLADEEAADRVAQRIVELAQAGQLESRGDLSNWRRSEVRLPTSNSAKGES